VGERLEPGSVGEVRGLSGVDARIRVPTGDQHQSAPLGERCDLWQSAGGVVLGGLECAGEVTCEPPPSGERRRPVVAWFLACGVGAFDSGLSGQIRVGGVDSQLERERSEVSSLAAPAMAGGNSPTLCK